jgi:hypothetical protein
MVKYKLLDFAMVREIKELLWDGKHQGEIANRFYVTQGHISKINVGATWAEVPWPDGSAGGLAMERKAQLQQASHVMQSIGRPLMNQVSHASPAQLKFREEYAAAEAQVLLDEDEARKRKRAADEKDILARVAKQDKADRKKRKKTKPAKTKPLDWAVVSETASHIGIVAQALADEDTQLQQAICRAYASLPASHWDDPITLDTIEQIRETL